MNSTTPSTTHARSARPRFRDAVERATSLLAEDPELRIEVSGELFAHLADSFARHSTASLDAKRAEQVSLDALGDVGELALQLGKANSDRIRRRSRLRLVQQWILPAVGTLVVMLIAHSAVDRAIRSFQPLLSVRAISAEPIEDAVNRWLERRASAREADHLDAVSRREAEVVRLIASPPGIEDGGAHAEALHSMALAQPHDPAIIANAGGWLMRDALSRVGSDESLDQILVRLDDLERVDSRNGIYSLMRAAVLLEASGEWISTAEGRSAIVRSIGQEDRFAQAWREIEAATTRDHIRGYDYDLNRRAIQSAGPRHHRLVDVSAMLTTGWLGTGPTYDAVVRVGYTSHIEPPQEADRRQLEDTSARLATLQRVFAAAISDTNTPALVRQLSHVQHQLVREQIRIAGLLGETERSGELVAWQLKLAAARERVDDDAAVAADRRRDRQSQALFANTLGEQPTFVHARLQSAESAVIDGLVLALSGAACVIAGLLVSAAGRLRSSGAAPRALSISWRGWAIVSAASVVAAVACLMMVDAHAAVGEMLQSNSHRSLLVPGLGVPLLVAALVLLASVAVVERRRRQLGLAPASLRSVASLVLLSGVFALIAFIIAIGWGRAGAFSRHMEWVVGALVIGLVIHAYLAMRMARDPWKLHLTYLSTIGPIVVTAGLVVALTSMSSIWTEKGALAGVRIEPSWLGEPGPNPTVELRQIASHAP
jgi:hypothetical protein